MSKDEARAEAIRDQAWAMLREHSDTINEIAETGQVTLPRDSAIIQKVMCIVAAELLLRRG